MFLCKHPRLPVFCAMFQLLIFDEKHAFFSRAFFKGKRGSCDDEPRLPKVSCYVSTYLFDEKCANFGRSWDGGDVRCRLPRKMMLGRHDKIRC